MEGHFRSPAKTSPIGALKSLPWNCEWSSDICAAAPSLVSNSHLLQPSYHGPRVLVIFCSHHDHGPRVSPRCSARSLLRMIGQGTHLSPKAMTVPGRADQKFGTILSPLIMYIAQCAMHMPILGETQRWRNRAMHTASIGGIVTHYSKVTANQSQRCLDLCCRVYCCLMHY